MQNVTVNVTVPDYYEKFSCIGPQCEDTCCSGWVVPIDEETYHAYERNRHPMLQPLFELALIPNTSVAPLNPAHYGVLKMKADQSCYFQQEDKLCRIHALLGESALSDTCRIYPRYFNQFGAQREHSLGISCPEAARLILLNPDPMQFESSQATTPLARPFTSYRFPLKSEGDPEQLVIF